MTGRKSPSSTRALSQGTAQPRIARVMCSTLQGRFGGGIGGVKPSSPNTSRYCGNTRLDNFSGLLAGGTVVRNPGWVSKLCNGTSSRNPEEVLSKLGARAVDMTFLADDAVKAEPRVRKTFIGPQRSVIRTRLS